MTDSTSGNFTEKAKAAFDELVEKIKEVAGRTGNKAGDVAARRGTRPRT